MTFTEFVTLPKGCKNRMYYVITMPLNEYGQGPVEGSEVDKITYEVWDWFFETSESFEFLPDAIDRAEELNLIWMKENDIH